MAGKRGRVDLLTIGIYQGERYSGMQEGRYVNRLITGVLPGSEGICLFEPDIETGAEVQFMIRDAHKMIESARSNSAELMSEIESLWDEFPAACCDKIDPNLMLNTPPLGAGMVYSAGRRPLFALYIDCAGRTAAFSKTAGEEATEIQKALNRVGCPLLGFYSGVEIAPFLNKSRGLDWTGLLLVMAGS